VRSLGKLYPPIKTCVYLYVHAVYIYKCMCAMYTRTHVCVHKLHTHVCTEGMVTALELFDV
jgi:hypothetical protein